VRLFAIRSARRKSWPILPRFATGRSRCAKTPSRLQAGSFFNQCSGGWPTLATFLFATVGRDRRHPALYGTRAIERHAFPSAQERPQCSSMRTILTKAAIKSYPRRCEDERLPMLRTWFSQQPPKGREFWKQPPNKLSHSVAGLARLELVVTDFGSDRRVLVLPDHAKHPRAARSGTTRILFRASGPPCFQEDHGTTRIESICQCSSKLGQRILNICNICNICSPISRKSLAQLAEGFALSRDADSTAWVR
jgi:hypothetical protein